MLSGGLRKKAQILVVEDEAIVAKDIEKSLEELGFEVSGFALSADEALARASEKCPDLVLMDIRIQGKLDGIETAKLLRERFHVPVVFLTAHGDAETMERAKKTKPIGYLLKPFRKNELRSVIDTSLFHYEVDKQKSIRERFFETTLHSIRNAILTVDVSGNILIMNQVAEKLLGCFEKDARQRPLTEVLRLLDEPNGKPIHLPEISSLSKNNVVTRKGFLVHGKNGSTKSLTCNFIPVSDDSSTHGAVIIFTDDEGDFEDRLRTLGTMAAGMVHDISNPLGSMILALESALSELKSRKNVVDNIIINLEKANLSAEHLRKIVTNFKNFCRKDDSQIGLVDVRKNLEWALDVARAQIQDRAKLICEIGELSFVRGNETKLSQVFLNLLINAAQAIPGGEAEKNRILVTGKTDSIGQIVIEIHDTGSGMDPETLKKIFTPFFTTKPVGVGTGLGLSICHGIIKAMNGSIDVESKVGKGSIFRITLPTTDVNQEKERVEVFKTNKTGDVSRILVIDDEPLFFDAIKGIAGPSYDVTCFASVREAMQLITSEQSFDVILCDLNMPEISGFQFYEQILRLYPDLARRIIFMSGGVYKVEDNDFLNAIPNPRLEKPFRAKELQDLLQTVA